VWVYTCWTHKTEHHGHVRRVAIGPKAQAFLQPFLKRNDLEAFVFYPKDAMAELQADRRARRGLRAAAIDMLLERVVVELQYPRCSVQSAVSRQLGSRLPKRLGNPLSSLAVLSPSRESSLEP
jgi:hypothetical protein